MPTASDSPQGHGNHPHLGGKYLYRPRVPNWPRINPYLRPQARLAYTHLSSSLDFDPPGSHVRCCPLRHGHMATTQSQTAKPFMPLKPGSPAASLQLSASPSPDDDFESSSFMPGRTSVLPVGMSIAGPSRTSSLARPSLAGAGSSRVPSTQTQTPSPRTPTSPPAASFMQEIDVFMENIGKLVKQLEDQHRQRSFDLAAAAPRHDTLDSEADGSGPQTVSATK
ncbi:hypothetical protein C8F04DRAFT_1100987 [Mycena alexandri]|uniref:Uncharacterized protein n=1 Tax=Mycena alexandri TaxID=1745969 RepID=A0AAD6SW31_9AGAR|nr:hypothetical protein C8F04DRAFT_1100987 [Mycena alexandri]